MRKLMGWTKRRGREQVLPDRIDDQRGHFDGGCGVVVEGVTKLMQRNTIETAKVDLTQQSREFMDQIGKRHSSIGLPQREDV